MRKKKKMNRNNHKAITPPQKKKQSASLTAGIAIAVITAASVCFAFWFWKTNAAASDFEKLRGKWLRPDGGYVLEIKQVANDGRIDAAYLNPRPINVSTADASLEAGKMNVFVELRDRLYPGNYYKLTYDAGKDQMAGVYYHLGIGQQFDVFFVRMK